MAVSKPTHNITELYYEDDILAIYADGLYDAPEFLTIKGIQFQVDAIVDDWTEKAIIRKIHLTLINNLI